MGGNFYSYKLSSNTKFKLTFFPAAGVLHLQACINKRLLVKNTNRGKKNS